MMPTNCPLFRNDPDRDYFFNKLKNPIETIVCSGDITQGLPLGDDTYPDGLREQYQQASDLLVQLTDIFLNGDRSKCIIVPENHDKIKNEGVD